MTDSYLNFANSPMGSRIAAALGLPRPVVLERFHAHQPVMEGDVLVGASAGAQWLPTLAQAFKSMQIHTVAHEVPQWTALCNQVGLMSGRWTIEGQAGARVKALVFDATGLQTLAQADSLYRFFHDTVRSCCRVAGWWCWAGTRRSVTMLCRPRCSARSKASCGRSPKRSSVALRSNCSK